MKSQLINKLWYCLGIFFERKKKKGWLPILVQALLQSQDASAATLFRFTSGLRITKTVFLVWFVLTYHRDTHQGLFQWSYACSYTCKSICRWLNELNVSLEQCEPLAIYSNENLPKSKIIWRKLKKDKKLQILDTWPFKV